MAVAVVKDGRLVMARGYGFADPSTDTPVEPTSLFRIASVSKPITAVATLTLIEAGQLTLEDKVFDIATDALPPGGAADDGVADITVAHLLYAVDQDVPGACIEADRVSAVGENANIRCSDLSGSIDEEGTVQQFHFS